MDRFIAAMRAEADGDLMHCKEDGVSYQADMTHQVAYDEAYYNKCASYEDQEIANKINAGRIALVDKFVGGNKVVDIGIGSGEFIKKRPNTDGFDVNPVAIEWLKRNDKWAHYLGEYAAHTFWDVLEHCETPELYLRHIDLHGFICTSIPVFESLDDIRKSKHYRPGEHLYYFTDAGFVSWMSKHGFLLLDRQDFETRAGRESILSYAFKRFKWPS